MVCVYCVCHAEIIVGANYTYSNFFVGTELNYISLIKIHLNLNPMPYSVNIDSVLVK